MDWVILFLLLVLLAHQIDLFRKLNRIESLNKQTLAGLNAFRVRQGEIIRRRQSYPVPPVDARARVTKRDTPDIPTTGRITKAVRRELRHERKRDDS